MNGSDGGVPEWLKGPVSKTGVPLRGTVGSNPTSSAGGTGSHWARLGSLSAVPAIVAAGHMFERAREKPLDYAYQMTRTFGRRSRNAFTPARVTFVFRTFSLTNDLQLAMVARPASVISVDERLRVASDRLELR